LRSVRHQQNRIFDLGALGCLLGGFTKLTFVEAAAPYYAITGLLVQVTLEAWAFGLWLIFKSEVRRVEYSPQR